MSSLFEVMQNVMAVCNSPYTNFVINNVSPPQSKVKKSAPTITFKGYYGGETFRVEFEKFATNPDFKKPQALTWWCAGPDIVIQFNHFLKDEVFQKNNFSVSFERLNVKLNLHYTENFVREYAHYFW